MESSHEIQADRDKLLAALHVIHDHMHHDRINEAHVAVEAAVCGKTVNTGNITGDDAARALQFVADFNAMCRTFRVAAAVVLAVPSATIPGYTSLQLGGHVPTVQYLDRLLNGKPSTCAGDHKTKHRRRP